MAHWHGSHGLKMTLLWCTTLMAMIYLLPGRSAAPYYPEKPLLAIGGGGGQSSNQLSSLDFLRYLLMDVKSKMYQNYPRTVGSDQTRKRGGSSSCLFNAGLAHNCDYRDVIGAVNEVNHWGSDLSPGRRKREARSADLFKAMIEKHRLHALEEK